MFQTARIEIPVSVATRLKNAAAFSDNVYDYAREDLVGFKRPITAAFAVLAPVELAVVFLAGGFSALLEVAAMMAVIVGAGVYIVGRTEWSNTVAAFQAQSAAKRKAVADLRCGFGESSFLSNGRSPRFYNYDHGVLALADAGDLKTLFFDISNDESDPRWALYQTGELFRRVWRWTRLPVSREVVKFTTEGSKLAQNDVPAIIRSIDAWEAVNVALGEPLDGALIHRAFEDVVDEIDRIIR